MAAIKTIQTDSTIKIKVYEKSIVLGGNKTLLFKDSPTDEVIDILKSIINQAFEEGTKHQKKIVGDKYDEFIKSIKGY